MDSNITCKLPVVGSDITCILNTEWEYKEVNLLLVHNNQAWSGKLQISEEENISELLDQLSLTEDQYLEETKVALTTHGGAEHFTYTIDSNKFTWKKYVTANMAIKFGFVSISKVPVFDAFEKIIDHSTQSNLTTNKKLATVKGYKEHLEKENQSLKIKLDDLIEQKKEMETNLYAKFLFILNEKKRKIRELKKKLDPDDSELDNENESDHYGSETDLDSENDEKLPSKTEIEGKGSLDSEDENLYTLPKRSRQRGKNENVAGPSGCQQTNNARRSGRTKQEDSVESSVSKKSTKVNVGRKKTSTSCVISEVKVEKEHNNSEEDTFTFPKRSRRTTNRSNVVNPSTSKVVYDSDEDETYCERTIKLEPDGDSTPSEIDISRTVKLEKVVDDCSSKKNQTKKRADSNGCSKPSNNSKSFSSSTLDMLNQLV